MISEESAVYLGTHLLPCPCRTSSWPTDQGRLPAPADNGAANGRQVRAGVMGKRQFTERVVDFPHCCHYCGCLVSPAALLVGLRYSNKKRNNKEGNGPARRFERVNGTQIYSSGKSGGESRYAASKPPGGKSVNLRTAEWKIDVIVIVLWHCIRPLPPFERSLGILSAGWR